MQPEVAQAALQFLQRCSINPQEIQTFLQVQQALVAIAQPQPRPVADDGFPLSEAG